MLSKTHHQSCIVRNGSRTSAARLAPKAEMKDLVAAYSTVKGDTMDAAAEEVYTKQPRSFLAFCAATNMHT